MSYKIAVASSDGLQIDETFGAAKSFIIYEVADGIYRKLEERTFREEGTDNDGISAADSCNSSAMVQEADAVALEKHLKRWN